MILISAGRRGWDTSCKSRTDPIRQHLWDQTDMNYSDGWARRIAAGDWLSRSVRSQKDDNAHIEQKNWTHVRRLFGCLHYDSPEALAAISKLYCDELRLLQNLPAVGEAHPQRARRLENPSP